MQSTNSGRAYSTDYASHRGLITKLAQRGFGRLKQAGVVIDFEDVFQEMSLIYCRAASGFDSGRGITFSAYLGRSIWNDFNKLAQRLIDDQLGLGLVRVEDLNLDDDSDGDEALFANAASTSRSAEDAYIGSRALADAMSELPTIERVVIGKLISNTVKKGERSLATIMREMEMSVRQMSLARQRIGAAFDVNLKGCK